MAESPAHKFGQVIGGLLESVVRPQLESVLPATWTVS